MKVQYGDACLSLQQVYERTRKFMNDIGSEENCSGRYTIGCALNQKILFLEVSTHFLSAETLVWNVMETTQRNEVIVYLLCSINYETKKYVIFKVFI
jgi:hypothetical protein